VSTGKRSGKGVRKVLDAWAVVAWLKNEMPASERVQDALEDADEGQLELLINVVNLGEAFCVVAKASDLNTAIAFLADFKSLPVRVLPAPNRLVLAAASLKAQYPISYADAFALATAVRERGPLLTGDPDLRPLAQSGPATMEWIGR